jgi:hypothetical protein
VKQKRFYITTFLAALAFSPCAARAQENVTPFSPPAPIMPPLDGALPLKPCHDSWQAARERWIDIADNPYSAFIEGTQKFDYAKAQVVLHYAKTPPVP